jgi:prophage regulatory protein
MATLLNRSQVLERLGNKSVSWLYEEMAAGRVPRPVRLGRSAVAWVESEIFDYIARRIAEGRVVLTAKPRVRKSSAKATPAAPETTEPRAA